MCPFKALRCRTNRMAKKKRLRKKKIKGRTHSIRYVDCFFSLFAAAAAEHFRRETTTGAEKRRTRKRSSRRRRGRRWLDHNRFPPPTFFLSIIMFQFGHTWSIGHRSLIWWPFRVSLFWQIVAAVRYDRDLRLMDGLMLNFLFPFFSSSTYQSTYWCVSPPPAGLTYLSERLLKGTDIGCTQ